ncbi:MAG: pyruvate kinase alpha/beta domain-containing protein [Planctomycetota bacterium]
MKKDIIYFEKAGRRNTDDVIAAVAARADELDIRHVVVASTSGETARKFNEALRGRGISVVCVTLHAGWKEKDHKFLSDEARRRLEADGIRVVMSIHALSGVGRSISDKFGTISHVEIIAHVLKLMGEGMKVAVEVSVMAADAGAIPTDREIIAVGGSGSGADTAIVLKAAHQNNFFDLEIREIIAMPRKK